LRRASDFFCLDHGEDDQRTEEMPGECCGAVQRAAEAAAEAVGEEGPAIFDDLL